MNSKDNPSSNSLYRFQRVLKNISYILFALALLLLAIPTGLASLASTDAGKDFFNYLQNAAKEHLRTFSWIALTCLMAFLGIQFYPRKWQADKTMAHLLSIKEKVNKIENDLQSKDRHLLLTQSSMLKTSFRLENNVLEKISTQQNSVSVSSAHQQAERRNMQTNFRRIIKELYLTALGHQQNISEDICKLRDELRNL